MILKRIVILVLLIGIYNNITAQCTIEKKYFKSNPNDIGKFVTSPLRWKTKDLVIAGSIFTSAAIAYKYDKQIADVFQRNQTNAISNSTKYFFQPLGNGFYAYPLVVLGFGVGYINQDCRLKLTALSSAKALIYTGIITQGLKYLAHRYRPYENEGPYMWGGPSLESNHHSFLSGHSSTTFTIASVVASAYADKPIVGYIAYTLATGTALSRIYDNKHWSSDVICGAALGYAIGKFCYNSDIKRIDASDISLLPTNNGIALVYKIR